MRFTTPVAAAVALSFAALTFSAPADARDRYRHRGGDVAAAGIFGLAAGAILGSALSAPRYYEPAPVYVAPPPPPVYYAPERVYVQPAPVYVQPGPVYYAPAAWSPEWYSYCSSKYRSFDPQTGYFITYGGEPRFCR